MTALPAEAYPIHAGEMARAARCYATAADVLLFYIRAGNVYYRQQRDRFSIERLLGAVPVGMTRFLRWGMSTTLRVQLEFGKTLIFDRSADKEGQPTVGTLPVTSIAK